MTTAGTTLRRSFVEVRNRASITVKINHGPGAYAYAQQKQPHCNLANLATSACAWLRFFWPTLVFCPGGHHQPPRPTRLIVWQVLPPAESRRARPRHDAPPRACACTEYIEPRVPSGRPLRARTSSPATPAPLRAPHCKRNNPKRAATVCKCDIAARARGCTTGRQAKIAKPTTISKLNHGSPQLAACAQPPLSGHSGLFRRRAASHSGPVAASRKHLPPHPHIIGRCNICFLRPGAAGGGGGGGGGVFRRKNGLERDLRAGCCWWVTFGFPLHNSWQRAAGKPGWRCVGITFGLGAYSRPAQLQIADPEGLRARPARGTWIHNRMKSSVRLDRRCRCTDFNAAGE